jgi:hypothetical protein
MISKSVCHTIRDKRNHSSKPGAAGPNRVCELVNVNYVGYSQSPTVAMQKMLAILTPALHAVLLATAEYSSGHPCSAENWYII